MEQPLDALLEEIRACRLCEGRLEPRPILHVTGSARLLIAGQAPGLRVHKSGVSFDDPSGERLRTWMGVDRPTFYDERRVAIAAMAFCFPGHDAQGGDRPPRRECARHWRERLLSARGPYALTLLVGHYAQRWHLRERAKPTMDETVRAWRDYAPRYVPLPHPSWRNNVWLKKNPWFERELLPYLRRRVRRVLSQ